MRASPAHFRIVMPGVVLARMQNGERGTYLRAQASDFERAALKDRVFASNKNYAGGNESVTANEPSRRRPPSREEETRKQILLHAAASS